MHANMRTSILILLGVIALAAGLLVYMQTEGFATYANYLQYMQNKYGTSSLCDPCYDPNCKTQYPLDQDECSPSASIPLPKYNPNEFTPYCGPTASESDFEKMIRSLQPTIKDTVKGALKEELASKDAVLSGSSGSLKMEKLPNPVQAPAPATNCSPAAAQGADYSKGCKPFNINEWIRKDSIPCYGCSLPA